jgi:Na+-translocating ferredoxin:NAD+ oxidoreductase RNF subunit RnfB
MEGLNDVNLKRGIDYSYSRLKTKVQKCSVDMIVMKEENEQLKKFKEEMMVKHLEMEPL